MDPILLNLPFAAAGLLQALLIYQTNEYFQGGRAQIQKEPPRHTIQYVVSWNIPEHQEPPSHSVQGSGLGGEILS